MNDIVKKALVMDEFENNLPDLEVGDIVKLTDVWDGNGEEPEDSYSYQITDIDWINYVFASLESGEVEIKAIELL